MSAHGPIPPSRPVGPGVPVIPPAPGAVPPGARLPTPVPSHLPPAPGAPRSVAVPALGGPGASSPAGAGPGPSPARRVAESALDAGFVGRVAGVGVRLAAFTIDVVVIAGATVLVWTLSASAVLGLVVLLELLLGLWAVEARTGLTPGNAILRLRTSRDDRPFSPGAGRGLLRRVIVGAGLLVAVVGAWVVEASGAWDASGRRRSWADRAAGTLVVAVHSRRERRAAMPEALVLAAPAPGVVRLGTSPEPVPAVRGPAAPPSASPVLAAPAIVPPGPRVVERGDGPTGARTGERPVGGAGAVASPAEPAAPLEAGMLVLHFDTGQRVQLALPAAANLGRNPAPSEPGDRVVAVNDPESTVSKNHLRLEHSRGRTWVTDQGSTNGTALIDDFDGSVSPLPPHNRVLLADGTRVRIGNRAFTVALMLGGEGEP